MTKFQKLFKIFPALVIFVFLFFVLAPAVRAQISCCTSEGLTLGNYFDDNACRTGCAAPATCTPGICPDKELSAPAAASTTPSTTTGAQTTVSLPNPLGTTEISIVIGNIIKGLMGLVGSIALLMFIYGGVLWLTSAGNSEKITKGRAIILWATLGLIVMFSSYVIVNFAISKLTEAPKAAAVQG